MRRKCILNNVIKGQKEGWIGVTVRRGRRCKQLLDDFKEKRGSWKLKQEALDCAVWRACFGRDYGPLTRPIKK